MSDPNRLRRTNPAPVRTSATPVSSTERSPNATDLSAVFRTLSSLDHDVVFLLDVSGSMGAAARAEMAAGVRSAVRRLLGRGAAITVLAFSDSTETLLVRSRNEAAILDALERLPYGGGTAMDRGFLAARQALRDADRAVVHLITDGMPNDRKRTIDQARLCHESAIAVRCTGTTGADLEFLKLLAGGEETKRAELVSTAGLRGAITATAVAALPLASQNP